MAQTTRILMAEHRKHRRERRRVDRAEPRRNRLLTLDGREDDVTIIGAEARFPTADFIEGEKPYNLRQRRVPIPVTTA